jgi:hypothetical protein
MAPVTTKVFNTAVNIIYTVFTLISLFLFAIALVALILAAIDIVRTNNLSSGKVDIANFTTWHSINGTLYKNAYTNNIVLLDPVPLSWAQSGKIIWVRLPLIIIESTLVGATTYMELHILNVNGLPRPKGDVLPWGASSSVTVGAAIFNVNANNYTRVGDISFIEYPSPDGESFIYDCNALQFGGLPDDSIVVIRGILVQYETIDYSPVSVMENNFISQYTTAQVIQSIGNGGKLPPLLK